MHIKRIYWRTKRKIAQKAVKWGTLLAEKEQNIVAKREALPRKQGFHTVVKKGILPQKHG
jgi:hypothetical protein